MKAVVGGGEPLGLWRALLRLRSEARRWKPLVKEAGGPVVLTLSLVREK